MSERRLEIKITPEMIAAGARSLALFDPEFATFAQGAERLLTLALKAGGFSVFDVEASERPDSTPSPTGEL